MTPVIKCRILLLNTMNTILYADVVRTQLYHIAEYILVDIESKV
jgi:hypothetical protein